MSARRKARSEFEKFKPPPDVAGGAGGVGADVSGDAAGAGGVTPARAGAGLAAASGAGAGVVPAPLPRFPRGAEKLPAGAFGS